jgi:penicillin-binding protein 2
VTQLPSARVVEGHLERRLAVGLFIVLVVWLLLLARLFYLQVVEGDRYRVSAQRNSVRTQRVIATRGIVFDRTGYILTDSRPSDEVLVVPHETEDLDRTLERLARLTGRDLEAIREKIGRPRGRARFQPLLVAGELDRGALARIEGRIWALPGVVTRASPVREYRLGEQAAHTLGWIGEISPAELKGLQGYRRGDLIGKDGVERLLDRDLRGRDGGRNVVVDAHGREFEPLSRVDPQPGKNVVLTLDHRLQQVAEQGFDAIERNGAAVALDPRNGEVLVLLSRPSFDPNRFAAGLDRAQWSNLLDDPGKPLHNRALHGQYPPGSTYKVVTALAGLEEGVVTPETEVDCGGSYRLGRRRYRCWKRWGHGVVNLHLALVQSCDVYFYQLGEKLGVDRLAYYARALGFGSATGIDLGREASGLVPTRAWKERRFGEQWIKGETISLAIGQGFNLWTPLQMVTAYAAIGNGGRRYRPRVVMQVVDPYGRLLRQTAPEVRAEVPISKKSLELVRKALRGVVHEKHGTGYVMRRLPGGVEAAGKTGTAQVVAMPANPAKDDEEIPIGRRDHAWFVTYAPAEEPRIAVAVLVEHGGHGGSAAAPIARQIVATFLENEQAEAQRVAELASGAAEEVLVAGD